MSLSLRVYAGLSMLLIILGVGGGGIVVALSLVAPTPTIALALNCFGTMTDALFIAGWVGFGLTVCASILERRAD